VCWSASPPRTPACTARARPDSSSSPLTGVASSWRRVSQAGRVGAAVGRQAGQQPPRQVVGVGVPGPRQPRLDVSGRRAGPRRPRRRRRARGLEEQGQQRHPRRRLAPRLVALQGRRQQSDQGQRLLRRVRHDHAPGVRQGLFQHRAQQAGAGGAAAVQQGAGQAGPPLAQGDPDGAAPLVQETRRLRLAVLVRQAVDEPGDGAGRGRQRRRVAAGRRRPQVRGQQAEDRPRLVGARRRRGQRLGGAGQFRAGQTRGGDARRRHEARPRPEASGRGRAARRPCGARAAVPDGCPRRRRRRRRRRAGPARRR